MSKSEYFLKNISISNILKYYLKAVPEGWIHWFNSNSFRGWWQFIKLSVPSTFMSIIEGGTFEAMTILAGLFGINELSSNTILNDLSMKIYISGIQIEAYLL